MPKVKKCPECRAGMYKDGWVWKNRHEQVQRYKCPKCRRTTIKTK